MNTLTISEDEFNKMRCIIMAWKKEEVFPLLEEGEAYPFSMWLDDLILCLNDDHYKDYHIRFNPDGSIDNESV